MIHSASKNISLIYKLIKKFFYFFENGCLFIGVIVFVGIIWLFIGLFVLVLLFWFIILRRLIFVTEEQSGVVNAAWFINAALFIN